MSESRIVRFSEQVGHRHISGDQGITIEMDRSCILAPDLSSVKQFDVCGIRLVVENNTSNGGNRVVDLGMEGAAWLRDRLNDALIEDERVSVIGKAGDPS